MTILASFFFSASGDSCLKTQEKMIFKGGPHSSDSFINNKLKIIANFINNNEHLSTYKIPTKNLLNSPSKCSITLIKIKTKKFFLGDNLRLKQSLTGT